MEFTVITSTGRMKIAAGSQAEAESIAKRDGHRVTGSPAYRFWLWMGDTEYGNEKMREAAAEVFARFPNHEPMIVEVVEHAGWWLHFNRAGEIVGTANDAGRLSDEALAFLKGLEGCETVVLGSLRRGETPAKVV